MHKGIGKQEGDGVGMGMQLEVGHSYESKKC